MNFNRLDQATRTVNHIEARMGCLLDGELFAGLQDACNVLDEVRHFAVCFLGVDQALAAGRMDADRAAQKREEAVTRLVQTFRPE